MVKNIWFSSDWHLGHVNVLKYDKRPFKNIQEHDETIIKNYHQLVSPEDDFYFLGDLTVGGDMKKIDEILHNLPGNKFFIKGNHDHKDTRKLYARHGTYLGYMEEIKIDGQLIVVCHYGMRVWNKSHHGSWHLFAHSHGTLPDHNKSFDVGVMLWDYKPASFKQISEKMDTLTFTPVDHHKGDR
jgi:calcineurin-like phosphoesterase family protein